MFRPASRLIARPAALRAFPRASAPSRRFISTAPPTQKSRSWKSLAARVGVAGTIIYYYNNTDVFAEEPRHSVQVLSETSEETEQLPTIDALAKERQQRKAEAAAAERAAAEGAKDANAQGGVEQLEEEADQQGAFNPETGEINWDCPCLGGMAHGPCGEQFKAAFSCFVFSHEEPKGMDCIDKFKDMQNCFREYPEIYGSELDADDEDDVTADRDQPAFADSTSTSTTSSAAPTQSAEKDSVNTSADPASSTDRTKAAKEQVKRDHATLNESDTAVPKAAFDETGANEEKK